MTTIKDGEYTATVYNLIRDGQYGDVIQILNRQLQKNTKSRAALSLLGFCYYHIQDFGSAAECYEQLTQLHPEVEEYKVYYAQSLYKAGAYPEATKATFMLDNSSSHTQMVKLQASIKYCEENYSAAKALIEQLPQDDPDSIYNMGCLLYQEQKYEEACKKFLTAMQVLGYQPALSYNIALCFYNMRNYNQVNKYTQEIIDRGIREHPELNVGMQSDDVDVHSVGNTLVLHESALIEALNLQAAAEYQLKNVKGAQQALADMPPRAEKELDPVTLHNQALVNMDTKPTEGFEKLTFLLQQDSFPPVTFGNLLLLYCKYEYFDLAADVLAENSQLTHRLLSEDLCKFLEALLTCQTAPEEALKKFREMNVKLTEELRKLCKQVQDARLSCNDEAQKKALQDYDQVFEKYLAVLMAEAKIDWNRENYQKVEKFFHDSKDICSNHDTWKLNVAHVLFMQNKYAVAIGYYEPIVKKHYENILNVSAVVLANLCVSYIMISRNVEAEELMKKIEKEEEKLSYDKPDQKVFHHCIVNLVIGTLYCSKGNYDFGISRIIKSLEPYNKKLGTDTWFYAKRCFLSLLENVSKQLIMVTDTVVQECIQFLEHCEVYGKEVPAVIEQPLEDDHLHIGKNTVTYEARVLKALFCEVTGWNM